MSKEQYEALMQILQEIKETVEMIAFDGLPDRCRHENTIDQSLMGMPPRSRVWCVDCESYLRDEE